MILRFLVYSNLFVSVCVMILTWGTSVAFDHHLSIYHLLFVMFSTLLVYNLQRFIGGAMTAEEQEKPFVVESTIVAISRSIVPAIIVLYCMTKFNWLEFTILIPAGVISLMYVGDLFLNKKNTGLRSVPFLKIFIVAIVWTMVTAVFPIANEFDLKEGKYVLLVIERMSFILAITIPFDIRDLAFDNVRLKTIPQMVGTSKSIKISLLFLLISSVMTTFLYLRGHYGLGIILGAIIFYLATFVLLLKVDHDKSDYYFTLWIEGTMLLWGCILLLG